MLRYIIAVAAIAVVAVSCEHNTYSDQELREIYDQGYQDGISHSSGDYDAGYLAGRQSGESEGFDNGYDRGWRDALAEVQQRANDDKFQFMDDWFGTDRVMQGCYELFNDWCDS